MVNLFENALYRSLQSTCRLPSLIEPQTFASDAVRIVNNRPLTSLNDQSNDLSPITTSSFLGQDLDPNTPVGSSHDKRNLLKIYLQCHLVT